MKFSVLIPVYNTEKYLEECLQSVLNQTYQNFEIIIVDDGSTDSSGAISDRYQNENTNKIKVIHQQNQGQLASRCNAIRAATGEYVIFVDADDLLIDSALFVIYNNLIEYNFPDILIYSYYYEASNGTLRKATSFFKEGIVDNNSLHEMFFIGTGLNNVWSKAVKRNIAECIDFDFSNYYSLRCAEDTLQSMVMVDQCEKAVYIFQQLYRYRLFDNSTTRRFSVESIENFNDTLLFDVKLRYAQKWGFDLSQWKQRIEANVIIYLLYVFDLFYMNNSAKIRKAVIEYPWEKFIPNGFEVSSIENNDFISKKQNELLHWILKKDSKRIRLYYIKKRTYRKARMMKRKITNHE